jgi:hypothetical protein
VDIFRIHEKAVEESCLFGLLAVYKVHEDRKGKTKPLGIGQRLKVLSSVMDPVEIRLIR